MAIYTSPVLQRDNMECDFISLTGAWYCCQHTVDNYFVVPKRAKIVIRVSTKPTKDAVQSDWVRDEIANELDLSLTEECFGGCNGPVWWWVEIVSAR
jgi:hypothetical protein